MARSEDPKVAALREARVLNPRPEAVTDEAFAAEEFLDPRDLVQVKYEMVRRVRVEGEEVSATAARFGFSRPSWYAAARALDAAGCRGCCRSGRGRAGLTSSPPRSSPSPLLPSTRIPPCGLASWPAGSRKPSGSGSTRGRSAGCGPLAAAQKR